MAQNQVLFNGYIAVDWSAKVKPAQGRNSIWVAVLGPGGLLQLENPRTREDATDYIDRTLTEATEEDRRFLCGFDFPFGYPSGTAQMLADHFNREDDRNWAVVWELIADNIDDRPNNWNNRFKAAAALNRCFRGEGPFWGRPTNPVIPCLGTAPPRNRWGVNLPPYRRHVERMFPGQAVWQLYGRGAVGSQALTGIAALQRRLRHRDDVEIWPFETLGNSKCHVLAEIYPSLIEPVPGYDVPDVGQVHAVAARLRELDQAGLLGGRLHAPESMPVAVRNEEGLFLDIA